MALGSRPPGGSRHYRRPDDRILDDIAAALFDQTLVDARDVSFRVDQGDVLLEGTVPGPGDRWKVEQICEGVLGVGLITNDIRMDPRPREPIEGRPLSETHWTALG